MTRGEIRRAQRYLIEQNRLWPASLVEVPIDQWPPDIPAGVFRVWRSRRFLVQGYDGGAGMVRLSVSRTLMLDDGTLADGITWDCLQELKAEAGFADREAVEIYPREADVVNVANMRHLWVFPAGGGCPWTWRAER